jgi:hypothetical protein
MEALINYLKDLIATSFYGSVELKVESGRLVHIIRHQSLMPGDLRNNDLSGRPEVNKHEQR